MQVRPAFTVQQTKQIYGQFSNLCNLLKVFDSCFVFIQHFGILLNGSLCTFPLNMNQNFLLSFEIFFITCSVTLSLVSFVTTDWIHKSHDKMSQGLWEVCVSHLCRSFSTIGIKEPPYIQAVRAFIIMSMVGQATSTCSIIYAFSNKSYHRKLTTALLVWSGQC